jgi:CBS domain-containing protein
MIGRPKTVARDASVGEARILFENPKNRLLLVDDDGIYAGHLMREDVPESEPDEAPILPHIRRECPQIGPDDPVAEALPLASETFDNRLVVLGEEGRLEGLLCLNRRDGYLCVDVRG